MKVLHDEKNAVLNQLRNRLSYLATDVGERERKLSSVKARYLKESREYKDSHKRGRGRSVGVVGHMPFMGDNRPYQMAGNYGTSYSSPWARGRARHTGYIQPWQTSSVPAHAPVPRRRYRIPDRELRRMSNIPDQEWGICWNFNSARGCPRGNSCAWRHEHYSKNVNHPITREPLKAPRRLTTAGKAGRQVIQNPVIQHPDVEKKSEECVEVENKSEDVGTGWPKEEPSSLIVPKSSAKAKAGVEQINQQGGDTEIDSKGEKSSVPRFGYNGGEPPESDSEESGPKE